MELSPGIIVEYGHNGKQTAERGCATRAQAGGDPIGQGRTPPRRHTLDGLIHERRGQVHDGPACLREHLPDRALRDVDELGQVDSEDRLKSVLLYSVNGEDAVIVDQRIDSPAPSDGTPDHLLGDERVGDIAGDGKDRCRGFASQ